MTMNRIEETRCGVEIGGVEYWVEDGGLLDLSYTQVADLTPLECMPLKRLSLRYTQVADLTPLQGMPLEWLSIANTKVSDLAPLNGMPLGWLWIGGTPAANLPLPEWMAPSIVHGHEGEE